MNWSPIIVFVSLPNCFLDLASAISDVIAGLGGRGGTYTPKTNIIHKWVGKLYLKIAILLKGQWKNFYIMKDSKCKVSSQNNNR